MCLKHFSNKLLTIIIKHFKYTLIAFFFLILLINDLIKGQECRFNKQMSFCGRVATHDSSPR